ncbi:hypothetical protein SAMN02745163_01171 [Clostridium cavendishii DSM 21758]|uniref:Uncharacterized protein n=1 Tax=Clostridium cavendishii DSM 21758 TaxID=1121302 RepID=A0A1M6FLG7_9CLOT|nr:hypothetical protein [Clostridium cavendishii]SHI98493.1 hypothetical protein SAMN02745163_01171 [Clostridium cavendishii DSM 21758]
MQFFITLVVVVVSFFVFNTIFNMLSISSELFNKIQTYTNKLKRKNLCKVLSGIVILLILLFINDILKAGIYGFGVAACLSITLNDALFQEPLQQSIKPISKKKNKWKR